MFSLCPLYIPTKLIIFIYYRGNGYVGHIYFSMFLTLFHFPLSDFLCWSIFFKEKAFNRKKNRSLLLERKQKRKERRFKTNHSNAAELKRTFLLYFFLWKKPRQYSTKIRNAWNWNWNELTKAINIGVKKPDSLNFEGKS